MTDDRDWFEDLKHDYASGVFLDAWGDDTPHNTMVGQAIDEIEALRSLLRAHDATVAGLVAERTDAGEFIVQLQDHCRDLDTERCREIDRLVAAQRECAEAIRQKERATSRRDEARAKLERLTRERDLYLRALRIQLDNGSMLYFFGDRELELSGDEMDACLAACEALHE